MTQRQLAAELELEAQLEREEEGINVLPEDNEDLEKDVEADTD